MIRSGAPRTGERSQTKWLWVGRPTLDIVGPVRNHTGYSLNTKRSVGEPAEGSLQRTSPARVTLQPYVNYTFVALASRFGHRLTLVSARQRTLNSVYTCRLSTI